MCYYGIRLDCMNNYFRPIKKQKISVEFTAENHQLVSEYSKASELTFGRVINFIIEMMLGVASNVQYDLARMCSSVIQEVNIDKIQQGEWGRPDSDNEIKAYQNLFQFFTGNPEIIPSKNKEKKKASVELL